MGTLAWLPGLCTHITFPRTLSSETLDRHHMTGMNLVAAILSSLHLLFGVLYSHTLLFPLHARTVLCVTLYFTPL